MMLSRVADSIYWMARSIERAENAARLLLVNQQLFLDAGAGDEGEEQFWQHILLVTGDQDLFFEKYKSIAAASVAQFLTFDAANDNSIFSSILSARENARVVRDQISEELWQSVNSLYWLVQENMRQSHAVETLLDFYERVLRGSYLFQGIARSTMPRAEGSMFLAMGTYIERADKTSRLIDTCSALPVETGQYAQSHLLRWGSLLHSCSAYDTFHEMCSQLEPKKIVQFLLLSPNFPRSVRYCVTEVEQALRSLPTPTNAASAHEPKRLAGRLRAELDFVTVDEILAQGLHAFIDSLQNRLNVLGKGIFETFVLYADLLPIDTAANRNYTFAGAWHAENNQMALAQHQQQQQQ
jgi:uncharacterized alpha-E superfamily protein